MYVSSPKSAFISKVQKLIDCDNNEGKMEGIEKTTRQTGQDRTEEGQKGQGRR
jgi:hypothetical protein